MHGGEGVKEKTDGSGRLGLHVTTRVAQPPYKVGSAKYTLRHPPPHPLGVKKVSATSPFLTSTHMERGKKVSFFGHRKNARYYIFAFQTLLSNTHSL